MHWPQAIKRIMGIAEHPSLPTIFGGADGRARIRDTLLQNPAVSGEVAVADYLISQGKCVFFQKGETIIEHGKCDNDVYFLISGEVDIIFGVNRFKSKKAAIRKAPMQVGEMAAIELGKPRSATVRARSEEVAALCVPGTAFRQIWTSNAQFQQRLQVDLSARHREAISAKQIAEENNSASWFAISLGAAFFTSLVIWLFAIPSSWTASSKIVSSAGAGIIVFLFTLIRNPAFFWRRCFAITLLALIGTLTLDRFVSVEAQQGLGSLHIAINSGDGLTDWRALFVFTLVLGICAAMDYLKTKP